MNIKLKMDKVLEIEKHGLSINKSAYLLGVSMPKLWRFIKLAVKPRAFRPRI